jgi:ABC-type transport system involved in multi-copper enzyme maturation permease subunit
VTIPSILYVLRWQVRDTFRQSIGSRVFWLVLGLTLLAILLCLSVRIEGFTARMPVGEIELFGPDGQPFTGRTPQRGHLSLGFGLVRPEVGRDGTGEVLALEMLLAKFLAGGIGIVLALLWTCDFIPSMLRADKAGALLTKPVPRWLLLVGKYLGAVALVAAQTTVFVVGTWLALAFKTQVWLPGYLFTIPVVVLLFAILYSVSVLLAVWTRSAAVCLTGTLLFWAASSWVVQARHELEARPVLAPEAAAAPVVERRFAEAGYWVLPKTVDLLLLLHTLVPPAGKAAPTLPLLDALEKRSAFHPGVSLVCSLLFGGVVVALAASRFTRLDY